MMVTILVYMLMGEIILLMSFSSGMIKLASVLV